MKTEEAVGDLLIGARSIASFIGGSSDQIRYWARIGRIPTFHVGGHICATRTTLLAWLQAQQARGREDRANRTRRPALADPRGQVRVPKVLPDRKRGGAGLKLPPLR